jgi:hypothetical protein
MACHVFAGQEAVLLFATTLNFNQANATFACILYVSCDEKPPSKILRAEGSSAQKIYHIADTAGRKGII